MVGVGVPETSQVSSTRLLTLLISVFGGLVNTGAEVPDGAEDGSVGDTWVTLDLAKPGIIFSFAKVICQIAMNQVSSSF